MAQVTPQIRFAYGSLLPGLVPPDTLREISQSELEDRLAQAHSTVAKRSGSTPGEQRAAAEQARLVLAARPRATVERMVADKIAKAIASDQMQADVLRRQARELLLAEPPAVRRARVAKAATPGRVIPVFSSRLRLLGVCEPRAIVQKASKSSGSKTQMQAVFDQSGALIGVVDPSAIQPVAGAGQPAQQPSQSQSPSLSAIQADKDQQLPADAAVAKRAAVVKARARAAVPSAAEVVARTAEAIRKADAASLAMMAAVGIDVRKARAVADARARAVADARQSAYESDVRWLAGQKAAQAQQVLVAKAAVLRSQMRTGDAPQQAAAHNQMQSLAFAAVAATQRRRARP